MEYYILIINQTNGLINVFKMRYSEIKEMHERLQKTINNYKLNIYLPLFPGRKLFSSTSEDESNILKLHSTEIISKLLP